MSPLDAVILRLARHNNDFRKALREEIAKAGARNVQSKLTKPQEKILAKYMEQGGSAQFFDDLPSAVQASLRRLKDQETLHMDADRWLSDASLRRRASEAFRPPKGIAAAVHDGKLPAQVLLIWKYVAEKMGDHFDYSGAVSYWRAKCKKEGIDLPPEFITGLGGKGVTANFPHKTGEQIEDWVRARLKSEGLIAEAGQTAAEIGLSITSIEQKIREAKTRVEQHMRGIEMGEKVTQRKKWLAKAQEELVALERQLEEARRGVTVIEEAAQRHEDHHAPSVSFEEQFQKLLAEATREMSQQQVLDKVLRSLAEFNAGLKAAESSARVAVLGDLWGVLERVWDKIKGVVASIGRWAKGLFSSATKLNDLLDKAGA